jgi:cystathionine gamma-synthase
MKIETLAVHAVDSATGAVSGLIHLSTTFQRGPDGTYPSGYIYSRGGNPNRDALERALAAIEGGAEAAAFSSGIAAANAAFHALAPGDHVVIAADAYHGTAKLVRDVFVPWGIEASFVDLTDIAAAEKTVRPTTKLIWAETPSNPLLKITDLSRVAALAHEVGAVAICDNTLAPILQRPLDHGFDLVMHSTTKYIGGHSDVVGGVLVTKKADDFFQRIREQQSAAGAVPSPFDCWLVLRGLRTLPWRMRAHSENASAVANFLLTHAQVEAVQYPGLPSHPQHDVAARQMSSFSGMISFRVRGDGENALAVAGRTHLFTQATSLGGVESLIEHRASIKGEDPRTPQNLLRLSVGLENAQDLIHDLAQALG